MGHFFEQLCKQLLLNILKQTIYFKAWRHLPHTYSRSHIMSIIRHLYYEPFYKRLPVLINHPSIKTLVDRRRQEGICVVRHFLFPKQLTCMFSLFRHFGTFLLFCPSVNDRQWVDPVSILYVRRPRGVPGTRAAHTHREGLWTQTNQTGKY